MKMRWYDLDVTVSKAISMLEKAEENTQINCADYIIDQLKDIDIPMSLDDQYNYIMRRWYDKNIKVSQDNVSNLNFYLLLKQPKKQSIQEYVTSKQTEAQSILPPTGAKACIECCVACFVCIKLD